MSDTALFHTTGLDAGPDDPVLGVYVLSQFAYCPRAGLCAYETRSEEDEPEPLPANVHNLPLYDQLEIERAFDAILTQILWVSCAAVIVAAVSFYITLGKPTDFAIAGICELIGYFGWLLPKISVLWELSGRYRQYFEAASLEPDPTVAEPQRVHWCQLHRAGFMSVRYQERLRHEAWQLEGKPWCVLRRGNLRIPVFRQPDLELHPKQFVKAAAYCHLLRVTENADSPYAIVLEQNSFEGVAIPVTSRVRKQFHEALAAARQVIRAERDGSGPPPPPSSQCAKCPLGEPIAYRPGQTEHQKNRVPLRVLGMRGSGSAVYHSHCGDRFAWVPPHQKVIDCDLQVV